ncbi:DUF1761 domain-containing protein [Sphingosinicella sp. CPCC 101087]|uniref:DUF1761 domain-containing protein n=1 Tax=Sphingosinicella sp. CPCC 101087 TaxID=2497754 RepID=UPI0013EAF112|nr:DUF1761 domain-containing protein [Sphingosinicella sp. CPCC 101087]
MPEVNLIAVFLCGVSSMLLGALWYAPPLLGRAWQRHAGLSDEAIAGSNIAMIMGGAFLLSLAAAYVFALFLGTEMGLGPSIAAGVAAGLFWVAAAFGINYLFERRPLSLWLINGGYHVLQFTLFGTILGLMA